MLLKLESKSKDISTKIQPKKESIQSNEAFTDIRTFNTESWTKLQQNYSRLDIDTFRRKVGEGVAKISDIEILPIF